VGVQGGVRRFESGGLMMNSRLNFRGTFRGYAYGLTANAIYWLLVFSVYENSGGVRPAGLLPWLRSLFELLPIVAAFTVVTALIMMAWGLPLYLVLHVSGRMNWLTAPLAGLLGPVLIVLLMNRSDFPDPSSFVWPILGASALVASAFHLGVVHATARHTRLALKMTRAVTTQRENAESCRVQR